MVHQRDRENLVSIEIQIYVQNVVYQLIVDRYRIVNVPQLLFLKLPGIVHYKLLKFQVFMHRLRNCSIAMRRLILHALLNTNAVV